jgi:multisubunit Na+/H+ antiporter MnhF subunit
MSHLEVSRIDAGAAVFLFLTLMGVLGVVVGAATPVDRMLGLGLCGALFLALLLLAAVAAKVPLLDDVALVLAVLGAVALSSFASRPRTAAARERAR